MKEFCKDCKSLSGAVKAWENNFIHIVQFYSLPSNIRRITRELAKDSWCQVHYILHRTNPNA